jgi:hypothetical protein
MERLKLITEASYDVELIESKEKDLYVMGVFSTANTKNANGRIYKKETLDRERKRVNEEFFKKDRPFWGELGHPTSPEANLDRIAIRTVALEWKGENLIGKAKVLDTQFGQHAKILLKEGPIGISSRGLGTVQDDGYVKDDTYKLLAYDLVATPSNNPSFVKGIYEGKFFSEEGLEINNDENIEDEVRRLRAERFNQIIKFFKSLRG